MAVYLTSEQEELKNLIEKNLTIIKFGENITDEEREKAYKQMREAAHTLHMQLEPKPKHKSYMIKNSGMEPEHPNFYDHIHPVEDLLSYLHDPTSNDEPEDITLGDDFTFTIYTNRWGHQETIKLTRVEEGWYVKAHLYEGTDKTSEPMETLYKILEHDSVSFPSNLDSYFSSIWTLAQTKGLDHDSVQEMIDSISEWVTEMEQKAPVDILI